MSERCFETAPFDECWGDELKFYYNVSKQECMPSKGGFCAILEANFFHTLEECQIECETD